MERRAWANTSADVITAPAISAGRSSSAMTPLPKAFRSTSVSACLNRERFADAMQLQKELEGPRPERRPAIITISLTGCRDPSFNQRPLAHTHLIVSAAAWRVQQRFSAPHGSQFDFSTWREGVSATMRCSWRGRRVEVVWPSIPIR
ncbi:MAG: hypothetical protein WKF84_17495 [Pyrinomonadaceae bacterium]